MLHVHPPKQGKPRMNLFSLATAEDVSEQELTDLVVSVPNPNLARRVAERSDMTPQLGSILANSRWAAVRIQLARNEHTPHEVLCVLANDDVQDVRHAARTNPNYLGDDRCTPLGPNGGGSPGAFG